VITIDDIARAAKVSSTTVSNVINGRSSRVSPATKARVNSIIAEMGYVPNMSARALVSQSSKVVALVNYFRTTTNAAFDDPFISRLTNAVECTLRENGYYLMLRSVSDADELQSFLQNWNVDGLFLTGVYEGDELYTTLRNINKPIVLTDSYLSDYGNMANVGLQDFEGAMLATNHLLKNGHTRIAFCSPPIKSGGVDDMRLKGHCEALKTAGVTFDPTLSFTSDFSAKAAGRIGRAIAARNDITAIFATADLIAAGVMAGIRDGGKTVPNDYSIIGFDDLDWCRLMHPSLTTVRQNTQLKGQLAADLMVSMLENESAAQNVMLPVHLVERESVRTNL